MCIRPSPGLLILVGTIKVGNRRYRARFLVDSGATHEFMDAAFAQRIGLAAISLRTPRVIRIIIIIMLQPVHQWFPLHGQTLPLPWQQVTVQRLTLP
jgi:hypothetical protein